MKAPTRTWLVLILTVLAATPALADTLSMPEGQRGQPLISNPDGSEIPITRGMTTDQVRDRFGEPERRVGPVGGASERRPPIHRWIYPDFTVYFERDRAVHAVRHHPLPHDE